MALIINGQRVSDEQLWEEMENLKAAAAHGPNPPNCCERDNEFMGYARDNMIARTLLIEEGRRRNIAVSPDEIDETFDKIVGDAGGPEQFYIQYNSSEDDTDKFKQSVGVNLLVQRVLEDEVGPKQEPNHDDVEAFYRGHIDQYMTSEQVRASHILKSLDHGADPNEAYRTLRELRTRLRSGEDFAAVADEHSDKPGEGGDLGFFAMGELLPEFEAVCFSMEVGEISPVFASPYGYHIATVTDRKAPAPIPLDEIRDQAAEHCRDQRHNEKMRAFVDKLRAAAAIEEVEDNSFAAPTHEHPEEDSADPVESVESH